MIVEMTTTLDGGGGPRWRRNQHLLEIAVNAQVAERRRRRAR